MTRPVSELIYPAKSWHVQWTCKKWHDAESFDRGRPADEIVEEHENLLLNAGIGLLLQLLTGASGTFAYNNANARIKVGDSSGAVVASGTDLLGGQTASAGMDSGFPTVSAQTVSWEATFGTGVGNFTWNEVGVINGSGAVSSSTILLNRKIVTFGTKTSSNIWQITATITIS
jgi:hypothetical protein